MNKKDIINEIERQIRNCKSGFDEEGERVFDPTAVILHISEAEEILELLKIHDA